MGLDLVQVLGHVSRGSEASTCIKPKTKWKQFFIICIKSFFIKTCFLSSQLNENFQTWRNPPPGLRRHVFGSWVLQGFKIKSGTVPLPASEERLHIRRGKIDLRTTTLIFHHNPNINPAGRRPLSPDEVVWTDVLIQIKNQNRLQETVGVKTDNYRLKGFKPDTDLQPGFVFLLITVFWGVGAFLFNIYKTNF